MEISLREKIINQNKANRDRRLKIQENKFKLEKKIKLKKKIKSESLKLPS